MFLVLDSTNFMDGNLYVDHIFAESIHIYMGNSKWFA